MHKLRKSLILCGVCLSLPTTSQAVQTIRVQSGESDTQETVLSSGIDGKLDEILQAIQEQNAILEEQHTILKKIYEYQCYRECAHCYIRFEYDAANDSFRLVLENFGLAALADDFCITLPPRWKMRFLKDSIHEEWGVLLPHQRVTIAETPKGGASAVVALEKEMPLAVELGYTSVHRFLETTLIIKTNDCPEWRKHLKQNPQKSSEEDAEEQEDD